MRKLGSMVFWVVAVLGAVQVHKPLGIPGLVAWTAGFALFALAGLADFYRWGHDYGHNLDPDAIIVVPGMSYQPPLKKSSLPVPCRSGGHL